MKLEKVDDKTAYENLLIKYAELEKENAGLKERLELLNLNANIAVRDLNDLLTKAKEIIKELIDLGKIWLSEEDDDYSFIEQAEQFLEKVK